MSVFALYLRSFIMKFATYGRYADLLLGLIVVGYGFYTMSWWIIALGIFSLFAFAVNLNGWIQRKAVESAQKRMLARRK